MDEEVKKTKKLKTTKIEDKPMTYYYAIGRRKEATARLRLYPVEKGEVKLGNQTYTKGQIVINGRTVEQYFPGELYKKLYLEPLRTTNNLNRFVITAKIEGGGLVGQLTAFIHGLARALETIDKAKYRPILKKRGFLTRDSRIKQRRKAGFAGKARKRKQSPKR